MTLTDRMVAFVNKAFAPRYKTHYIEQVDDITYVAHTEAGPRMFWMSPDARAKLEQSIYMAGNPIRRKKNTNDPQQEGD